MQEFKKLDPDLYSEIAQNQGLTGNCVFGVLPFIVAYVLTGGFQ